MCLLISSTNLFTKQFSLYFILRRTEQNMIKMCIGLVKFYLKFSFLDILSKRTAVSNLMNGSRVPCGRTDGRDEAKSRYSQFCERA